MTPQEFKAVLRPWLDRQPFVPFAFVLTTGERQEVHLRSAIRYPDGSAAYVDTSDDSFDEPIHCEDVERIEPLPQQEIRVMTPVTFFNELRRLCDRDPFRPFVVELTTGERIEIDDPEGLAFAGGYATFINAEGEPTNFDYTVVARLITPEATAPA
jgi:hypothetical protein